MLTEKARTETEVGVAGSDGSICYSIDEYAGGSLICDRGSLRMAGAGWRRTRRVTMRQCVVKCARLSRGSRAPKEAPSICPPSVCVSMGPGVLVVKQKLTLTGLTRLRTSVETVLRNEVEAEEEGQLRTVCGVDDDGAPSSLVRNA